MIINIFSLTWATRHSCRRFSHSGLLSVMVVSTYFLIISTSPFSFSLIMLEGVWGLCS